MTGAELAVIKSLVRMGLSAGQAGMAMKYAQEDRPDYEIPSAYRRNLENARYYANQSEMPGAGRMNIDADRRMSMAIWQMGLSADNPNQVIDNLSRIVDGRNKIGMDIAIRSAEVVASNQAHLRQANKDYAEQELKAWSWNKQEPYTNAQKAAASLFGASINNFSSAIGSAPTNQENLFDFKVDNNKVGDQVTSDNPGSSAYSTMDDSGYLVRRENPVIGSAVIPQGYGSMQGNREQTQQRPQTRSIFELEDPFEQFDPYKQ